MLPGLLAPLAPLALPGLKGPPVLPGAGVLSLWGLARSRATRRSCVLCPLNLATPDPNDRLFAISGGFNIQGSVTASYALEWREPESQRYGCPWGGR